MLHVLPEPQHPAAPRQDWPAVRTLSQQKPLVHDVPLTQQLAVAVVQAVPSDRGDAQVVFWVVPPTVLLPLLLRDTFGKTVQVFEPQ